MPTVEQALASVWESAQSFIGPAIAATIVLVIGFILGRVLGRIVKEILVRTNVDKYIAEEEHLNIKPSHIGSVITRWAVYLVFIRQAAILLGVKAIEEFVASAYTFILGIVAAVVTILIGYGLAIYLKDRIITSRTIYADITGKVVFFLVIYLSIAIGLNFIQGVNATILENILLIFVGSIGLGLAIAIGLGLKDVVATIAKEYAKEYTKKLSKSKRA
jgi:uncharacterized protein (DUF697 family)